MEARSSPRGMAQEMLRLGPGEAPPVEDLEYLLGAVIATLSRLDSKRGRLQDGIAAASRGRRAHAHRRAPAPAPGDGRMDTPMVAYARKGVGAVRRRLRAAAGDVKKERERLEAVWGVLEEAIVDAKERLALPRATA